MTGLYVHIPFCVRKCAYCDFYSLPDRLDLVDSYVDAVLREAHSYARLPIRTLYLGGGTPSLLGARGLDKLIGSLYDILDFSESSEATLEVNPESATESLLDTARDVGIDRLSIGIQSLSDRELRSIGRAHTARQAIAVVNRAVSMGFGSVSVDVIVGLPGQEWRTLRATLKEMIELGVRHVSLYCLSLEPGTPLAANPPDDLPSEDEQADFFEQASAFVEGHGLVHYEISNFALPGQECQHNINYWRGGEYLGLGAAASSHLDGKRFRNRAGLEDYIHNPSGLVEEVEELGAREKAAEEAMLRLRLLSEGLVIAELTRRFGWGNIEDLVRRLDEMVRQGCLTCDGSAYRLERSRVLTSNPIFARVLG